MSVRLRFSKLGKIRFTSHRDVARIWERASAGPSSPCYSEGFSPRPKLTSGWRCPPATSRSASTSTSISTEAARTVRSTSDALHRRGSTRRLPVGIDVHGGGRGSPPGTPSLQQAVTSCTWRIEIRPTSSRTTGRAGVDRVAGGRDSMLTRERKGSRSPTTSGPTCSTAEVVRPTPAPRCWPTSRPSLAAYAQPSCWPPCSRSGSVEGSGHPNAPMDLHGRRAAGASAPARRDVSVARRGACVMRREHLDVRSRRRRSRRAANAGDRADRAMTQMGPRPHRAAAPMARRWQRAAGAARVAAAAGAGRRRNGPRRRRAPTDDDRRPELPEPPNEGAPVGRSGRAGARAQAADRRHAARHAGRRLPPGDGRRSGAPRRSQAPSTPARRSGQGSGGGGGSQPVRPSRRRRARRARRRDARAPARSRAQGSAGRPLPHGGPRASRGRPRSRCSKAAR